MMGGIQIDQSSYAAGLETIIIQPDRAKQTNYETGEKDKLKKVAGRIGWLGRLGRGTISDLLFNEGALSTKVVTS